MKLCNLLLILVLALAPVLARGQTTLPYSASPSIEVTGTGTTANDTPIPVTDVSRFRWLSLQLKGTWSGTVTFEASNDNVTWVPVALISVGSTSAAPVTSATANDLFHGPVSAHYFRARLSTASSGTVTGVADFSTIASGWQAKAGGAGGGSGTVTNIATTAPLTGGPITTTGTLALDPAAAYTMGSATINGTLAMGANAIQFTDTTLIRDGANSLAQRNGTNPQIFRVYNTYPAGNDEFFEVSWQASANFAFLRTNRNAAGGLRAYGLAYPGVGNVAVGIPAALTGQLDLANAVTSSAIAGRVIVARQGTVTATSGTHSELSVSGDPAPTASSTLAFSSLTLDPVINYSSAGAGTWDILRIAVTETANPTGAKNLINALAGASATTPEFVVNNGGELYFRGVSEDATTSVLCVKADKNIGTCTSVVGAGGTCTCG